MTARRSCATTTAALAASLVLAACSADAKSAEDAQPGSEQSRGAGSLEEVSPLTGAPIGDQAPEHPVLVVKVDNTSSAAPQLGLSDADLVVEELVEGGLTRLAVMFWEQTPQAVGPVRSMRATDIGIVQPLEAVLVASGGADKTTRRIAAADIAVVRESGTDPGFSRDSGRSAPYDLMLSVGELAGSLDAASPPAPYLPFGPEQSWPGGKPAQTVDVTFSAAHTTAWRFEPGTGWVRPGSLAAQGDDFVPDSVLVLSVDVGDAGYVDAADNSVPEELFFGEGEATLLHAGEAVEGRWLKDGADGSLELTTLDGKPLEVPVGNTWIELLPNDTGSIRYGG